MFVIDRRYLKTFQSKTQIKKTTKSVKIRDIDNTLHESSKYIEMNFYVLKRLTNKNKAITHFKQKIHVVNDLRVNMLLKSNIFDSKKAVIDIKQKSVIFKSCKKLSVSVNIIVKKRRIIRAVRNATQLTISVHSCMLILIKIKKNSLSTNRDYFFHSKKSFKEFDSKKDFFNYITNANIVVVQIRNTSDRFYILSKNVKIDMLRDFKKEKCYLTLSKDRHRTISSSKN